MNRTGHPTHAELLPEALLRRFRPRRLLAAALLITCCSCQAVPPAGHQPRQPLGTAAATPPAGRMPGGNLAAADYGVQLAAYAPADLPASAWTGAREFGSAPGMGAGTCPPCPACEPPAGFAAPPNPWRPPGISGHWPGNEYLCDGGDQGAQVEVMRDRTILGLDREDTVAQYDTVDGRTEVKASNPVCLYAPRFAAVRQVSGLLAHEGHDRLAGVALPLLPGSQEQRGVPTTVLQPVEPERYVGTDSPHAFRERVRGESVDGSQPLAKLVNRFRAYEDFRIIRTGAFDNAEKARLAQQLDAALVWSENQAVQVTIEKVTAVLAANDVGLQSVYRYELPPGKPRLRVVKVASKKSAQPGEEVEFTIRFDNVGDQTVGNVTLVDSLTTRLQYVPDTAQCSLEARFHTQENEAESLVLRWEIRSPLKVGEGGVIRFTCRVR
ncbi:MAG: DUF11 domain-containing protein [Candidatus Anammoximicrobium sp.]|nr:DUF11 domain-containing protein [Candidatus Anammoximicrobium sp.]